MHNAAMLPALTASDALFLDFDGSLVELAPRPSEVVVSSALLDLLGQLQDSHSGALAVISGRPISGLDELLQPFAFAAAGEHGAELRAAPGESVVQGVVLPESAAAAIAELAALLPGTELELKHASASLHYRGAPQHKDALIEGMQRIAADYSGYALMFGKMVAELKPANVDKGVAIRELCARPLFANRRPVFVGDDVTDEPGFVTVNELGGISLRVGGIADSHAQHSLDSVAAVHNWLREGLKA